MAKLKVAILYGGRSVEHGVSINSARNIFEFIDKENFEPVAVGITQDGVWYRCSGIDADIDAGTSLSIRLNPGTPELIGEDGNRFVPDVVFPVLHGTDGEDGSIQGMLKALDIPMVGTGVAGSAMSINKLIAKKILREAGIPVADFMYEFFGEKSISFNEIKNTLGLPFMVKSANLGSSVGVSKVKNEEEFVAALKNSYRYDDCVLFEKFVKAREIECAVMGNSADSEHVRASMPGEIIIGQDYDFYTFDAKYVDGAAVQIEVPAHVDETDSARIRDLSVRAYQALHCEDFARVDLFLTDDGEVYVNEINTIPGFTNSSMFPMMWKEQGISFKELISRLISLAQQRYQRSKRIERGFVSDLKF